MTHQGTITLETERLTLRRFTERDADAMFRNWANDDEVTKFLTWKTHTSEAVTSAVIQNWIVDYEKNDNYQWAIEVKADAEIIGSISVVGIRELEHTATIGYCIGRSWWRQGYTSEATSEIIRFLIADVGFNRIQACHDPRNPNSGEVMRKCGLKYEGLNRQAGKNNMPGFCDEMWYAILAEDYFAEKSPLRKD
jgi:ribosomal-protein-alanine N-acetyltransferase